MIHIVRKALKDLLKFLVFYVSYQFFALLPQLRV